MLNKFLYFITPKAHAQTSIMGEFRRLICPGATTDQKITDCMTQLDLGSTVVLVNVIIRVAFGLAGIIALIYLIYSGYLYMISIGNPDSVAAAKQKMMLTVLGLVIIILAYLIVTFVLNIFGAPGATINNPLP